MSSWVVERASAHPVFVDGSREGWLHPSGPPEDRLLVAQELTERLGTGEPGVGGQSGGRGGLDGLERQRGFGTFTARLRIDVGASGRIGLGPVLR